MLSYGEHHPRRLRTSKEKQNGKTNEKRQHGRWRW